MPRLGLLATVIAAGALVARLTWSGAAQPLYSLEQPPRAPTIGDLFDPNAVGAVRGRVRWNGPVPQVPAFRANRPPVAGRPDATARANPNAPRIDPATSAVAGAVVFLRGVDPRRSRPWDQPPVQVEFDERQIRVHQGPVDGNVGFVQAGDAFTMVSVQDGFFALRSRGSEFFTLMFPEPDRPLRRTATRVGLSELSSAAHYFWQRAYLFTADHSYYTRTDARGEFALEQVPAGDYDVVCWLPNWNEVDRERDPELCQIARVHFGPSVERVVPVRVEPTGTTEAHFSIHAGLFRDR